MKIFRLTERQINTLKRLKEQEAITSMMDMTKMVRKKAKEEFGAGTPEYYQYLKQLDDKLDQQWKNLKVRTLEGFIEWLSDKTECGRGTGHGFTKPFIDCFFEVDKHPKHAKLIRREATDILHKLYRLSEMATDERKYVSGNIHLMDEFLRDIEPDDKMKGKGYYGAYKLIHNKLHNSFHHYKKKYLN